MLWAQGPGGSNRTTAGKTPRGLRPRSSSQQRSPGRDRSVWRRRIDVAPIPNLAYYLVVNVRGFFAGLGKKGKASPSRGGRSRTHVRRVGAGCPFRWTTPLRVSAIQLSVLSRNTKEPPPFGSGSSTNWTFIGPSYAVEGTSWGSVATQLKDWAFSVWAMARPRDVKRLSEPSGCRCVRQLPA